MEIESNLILSDLGWIGQYFGWAIARKVARLQAENAELRRRLVGMDELLH
ncbi:MAG: hypothetical protein ACUVRJ_05390 [Candidatus Villigracilaceae bacterium]